MERRLISFCSDTLHSGPGRLFSNSRDLQSVHLLHCRQLSDSFLKISVSLHNALSSSLYRSSKHQVPVENGRKFVEEFCARIHNNINLFSVVVGDYIAFYIELKLLVYKLF